MGRRDMADRGHERAAATNGSRAGGGEIPAQAEGSARAGVGRSDVTRQVQILAFDGMEVLDYAGPYEVFNVAGEQDMRGPRARERRGQTPPSFGCPRLPGR
jgi:putative intracellular protease/amidase